MHEASHPCWSLLRIVAIFGGLTGLLWLNAQRFDSTEMLTLAEYALVAAGIEGGIAGFKKLTKKE